MKCTCPSCEYDRVFGRKVHKNHTSYEASRFVFQGGYLGTCNTKWCQRRHIKCTNPACKHLNAQTAFPLAHRNKTSVCCFVDQDGNIEMRRLASAFKGAHKKCMDWDTIEGSQWDYVPQRDPAQDNEPQADGNLTEPDDPDDARSMNLDDPQGDESQDNSPDPRVQYFLHFCDRMTQKKSLELGAQLVLDIHPRPLLGGKSYASVCSE